MINPKPFNDGICTVCLVEKRTIKEKLGTFNFRRETVGIKAYTDFQTLGIEIEKVISIPYNKLAEVGRVVDIEGDIYLIEMIQEKDTFPKSLRLTLSKSPLRWDMSRDGE